MPEKKTFHIHIKGKVQGVGFRPFVYGLANEMNLAGEVSNGTDGVRITVNATEEEVGLFHEAILGRKPDISFIQEMSLSLVDSQHFSGFHIVPSNADGIRQLLLTPDLDVCDACLAEMRDATNRRYRYPFITCTYCGPRFSIIHELPYDRGFTSMDSFDMCESCLAEYDDPADRRFYSQTNSCGSCGVQLALLDRQQRSLASDEAAIEVATQYLDEGRILAVKGIGGFLLLADASNSRTLQLLRQRKLRLQKPFALMFPGLAQAAAHVRLPPPAQALLSSRAKPILLLPTLPLAAQTLALPLIAPGLHQLGVMLPYAPLLHLLLDRFAKPAVATSANLSQHPILFNETTDMHKLTPLADYILTHNRKIVVPQDDSVLTVTPMYHQPIIMRRSRGFAPTVLMQQPTPPKAIPLPGRVPPSAQSENELIKEPSQQQARQARSVPTVKISNPEANNGEKSWQEEKPILHPKSSHIPGNTDVLPSCLLALGAQQKGTFSLLHQGNTYVSPYLGELASYEHEELYKQQLHHMLGVLHAQPEAILIDSHPDYFTHRYGKALAEQWQIPFYAYPHHRAHFAAILSEHNLWDREGAILGIIWDGTGYGEDGHIWGSECFVYQAHAKEDGSSAMQHYTNLSAFPHLFGDKMSKEARLSALAVAHTIPEAIPLLNPAFSNMEWKLYSQWLQKDDLIPTHSMGRLFDAVASLLKLVQVMDYEGEAAIKLEQLALTYSQGSFPNIGPYSISSPLHTKDIIRAIIHDILRHQSPSYIAYRFHLTLAHQIFQLAAATHAQHIAFSGGVFQNRLLVDLCIHHCPKEISLYFHELLSPNDENISFGQLQYHMQNMPLL